MNRLLKSRGKILAALFMLSGAVSLPAWAEIQTNPICSPDSQTEISLHSVNLRQAVLQPGTHLYTSQTYSVPYTCKMSLFNYSHTPSLRFTDNFSEMVGALIRNGLKLEMTITDKDNKNGGVKNTPISWEEIKKAAGRKTTIPFGVQIIRSDEQAGGLADYTEVHHTLTITLSLYVEYLFDKDILIINSPSMPAFSIISNALGYLDINTRPVTTGAFSIRIFPEHLGSVKIFPSLVSLGHFYTSDNKSKRSELFTVTAKQDVTPAETFTVPLKIKFVPPVGLTLTDNNQAMKLKNKSDTNDNGLQLSVVDTKTGTKVTFNQDENMGDITMNRDIANGLVGKTYVAVLDKTEGAQVTTGNFSAACAVIVTYN